MEDTCFIKKIVDIDKKVKCIERFIIAFTQNN